MKKQSLKTQPARVETSETGQRTPAVVLNPANEM